MNDFVVLFANHTSLVAGAERSLLELIAELRRRERPRLVLACPVGGLASRARAAGIDVVDVPGTSGSLRLNPLQTPVALVQMLIAGLALRKAARKLGADVVHANSTRAALIAVVARALGGPPVLAHVRDILPPSRSAAVVAWVIRRWCKAVATNSTFTAGALTRGRSSRAPIEVVYNPVDLDRFASSGRPAARAALGLDDETPVLLIVGYIAPLKGQREAIQTLIEVRRTYPSACLLIAGETKFVSPAAADDSVGYERELRELAETLATGAVRFLGERDDLPDLMAAADLVLAPSWREAFGRAVVEAMAAGVCVIATEEGGPTEYIEDGVNGILLPPHDPERWGRVATDLLSAPERRDAIGAAAQVTSRRFSPEVHADAVIALYKQVLDRS